MFRRQFLAFLFLLLTLIPVLHAHAEPEPEDKINFYSGIDVRFCNRESGGCYVSSFGYEWLPVHLKLTDYDYNYWTGTAEQRREYRGLNYLARVFIEQWRFPFNKFKVTVEIGEEGKPETFSQVKFWVKDIHDFVHFDLQAGQAETPGGSQRPILSFGPEYRVPVVGQ